MPENLVSRLSACPVVPLIQADDPDTAVRIARALAAGGMPLVEVVQRTAASLENLAAISETCPELVTGAGTVLSERQCETCIDAGARFIVSPGLDAGVVACAQDREVGILPGIMTPSEVQLAHNLGLEAVKFFPATIAGGVSALQALASVFRSMRFIPTGGISAENLPDFLALPSVIACGGSWLTPADAIRQGNFEAVTRLAKAAITIAKNTRESISR